MFHVFTSFVFELGKSVLKESHAHLVQGAEVWYEHLLHSSAETFGPALILKRLFGSRESHAEDLARA